MNINLGLITIGNGNWKKMISDLWNSLEIADEGYRLQRAIDEYEYKLTMDNKDLPSYMTNYDLHLKDDNELKVTIGMPVISNCEDMVIIPWYDEEFKYTEASKICSEQIMNYCDYIVILEGDSLDEEEKEWKNEVIMGCVDRGKIFWEIGNDCGCFKYDVVLKWIESRENYCSVFGENVVRMVKWYE